MNEAVEDKTLRIGLIGAGNWARYAHLPAFSDLPGVQVVGITDIDPSRSRALGIDFKTPVYPSLDEMLEDARLDVLDIVTSRGMHYRPVMAGLQQGLDILCEKPLGHTLEETRKLYQEARRRKVVTFMGFTFRFSPAVRYLRDLVLQGFCGEIYHFQGFEQNALLVDPETPLPRIGFSPKTDSGALHGYGSHLLDLARWTLGEFDEVIGDMATCIKERPVLDEDARLPVEVDDSTTVLARFAGGAQAVMQFSKVAMGYAPGVEMRIYGSRAALWVRLEESPEGYEHLWVADRENRNFRPLPVPPVYTDGHDLRTDWPRNDYNALLRDFVRRVRERDLSEGSSDFCDGLRAQELLEAIERSARQRRWVKLSEIAAEAN